MHVNNLGGARMPVTTAERTTQTARTSFGTLLQGAASIPTTSPAAIPGSSIVATAIANSSGGTPGSGFGAPYLQGTPTGVPVPGLGGATPAAPAGSEFNGELTGMMQEQQQKMLAIRELVQMSLMSFMQGIFAMGQNRPQPSAD
ncbi:MAG: hypothetical protein JXB05_29515 [Myxococcaceae bacterium]|nr:hypothetical protein [Myxococcaceae bacterium]